MNTTPNAIRVHEAAKKDSIAQGMSAVADEYAHRLAMELECVLAGYNGIWYDSALKTLSGYRDAMNKLHEQESPTFMGEPVLADTRPCTCHPDDNPPSPCQKRYALSECRAALAEGVKGPNHDN